MTVQLAALILAIGAFVAGLVSLFYAWRARCYAREGLMYRREAYRLGEIAEQARGSLAELAEGEAARPRNPIGQPDPKP